MSFDLYSLRPRLPHGTSSTRVGTTSTERSLARIASARAIVRGALRELDAHRQRRVLLDPGPRAGPGCCPLTCGANAATTSRSADGKTLTPRTISMSSVRPMQRIRGAVRPQPQGSGRNLDMVAGPKSEKRRTPMLEVCQDQFTGGAVFDWNSASRCPDRSSRNGRSRARKSACRPGARIHPIGRRRCRRSPSSR